MKKWTLIIFIISLVSVLSFRTVKNTNADKAAIDAAINKSLPLLQKSSHVFLKNAQTCHSCHGQGLGGITFSLAKEKGFAINDTILYEALDSIVNDWTALRSTLAQNDDTVAIIMTGSYDLWALSANNYKPNKIIELLARNIMRRQTPDGSWVSPNMRPPLEYYPLSATALAIRGIKAYVPAALHEEVTQRIEKARTWLINAVPQANEEKIYQLLGLKWSDADPAIIKRQAKKLLAAQHDDGGWPQLDSLSTDAYATGQSLYALNQTGQLDVNEPAYQKGIEFLLRTQFNNGSWKVKSRSFPFVSYVYSGFPHDNDQFISAAGTNWATMALLLASK